MSVIRHPNFDITVNNIGERNALKKVDHMVVIVTDAIADVVAGAGKATYRWDGTDDSWILVSKSNVSTVTFATEEHLIVSGTVTLENVPKDDIIWNVQILNGDVMEAELRVEDMSMLNGIISNLNTYDGKKLRCTYAYGSIAAQIGQSSGDVSGLTNRVVALEASVGSINDTAGNVELPGYDTEEILTEKRWINGKPIYRKVLEVVSPATGLERYDSLNLGPDVENCSIASFRIISTLGWNTSSDSHMANFACDIKIDGTELYLWTGDASRSERPVFIVVEYTKTVDTSESPIATIQATITELTAVEVMATLDPL